jgi:putative membrane protein
MRNIVYLSAIILLGTSFIACNEENRKAKNYNEKTLVDDKGLVFIKTANEASLAEIKSATLAQSKSQNPRVINFAKMMIADHTAAGNELQKLADNKDVTHNDNVISKEHQQMINNLTKLNGLQFDKAYMGMMVTDHVKTIDNFKSITRNTSKNLVDFSEKTLPKLTMHLDSAKAINASLK